MAAILPKKTLLPLVLAIVFLISLSGGSLKAITGSILQLQHQLVGQHATNAPNVGCPPPPYDCW